MLKGVQIIVHDDGKCKNSWGACCFMDMVAYETDKSNSRILRCPMCREEIYDRAKRKNAVDFQNPGPSMPTAFLRVMLFTPDWARLLATKSHLPFIFMSRQEVAKLSLWGSNKQRFLACDSIVGSDGLTNPFKFWILADCGHNEYRMCPFTPSVVDVVKQSVLNSDANFVTMDADQFDRETLAKGILLRSSMSTAGTAHSRSSCARTRITLTRLPRDRSRHRPLHTRPAPSSSDRIPTTATTKQATAYASQPARRPRRRPSLKNMYGKDYPSFPPPEPLG